LINFAEQNNFNIILNTRARACVCVMCVK